MGWKYVGGKSLTTSTPFSLPSPCLLIPLGLETTHKLVGASFFSPIQLQTISSPLLFRYFSGLLSTFHHFVDVVEELQRGAVHLRSFSVSCGVLARCSRSHLLRCISQSHHFETYLFPFLSCHSLFPFCSCKRSKM